MIWLFERGHEDLRVETAYDNLAGQYVLTIRRVGTAGVAGPGV